MVDIAQLEIRVNSLEVQNATLRMKVATLASDQLEKATGKLEKQFLRLNGAVQNFRILGSALAAGFVITRVANSALIRTISEYETSLVTLRAVTTDASKSLREQEAAFKKLDETARKTGQTTRFSALEAAEGLLTLAKAGLTADESISALPAVLALAQGQLIDVDAATQVVTSAMRQFGIAAVDAARITDVLAETANRTSTDVTNLGTSFRFVGPIASQMGLSLEETAGALGVLANSGIQGSLAGTTLRGVLTALIAPTDVAKKAIAGLGLTVDQLNPSTHSIEEIIQTLAGSFIGTAEAVDIFNKRNAVTALILTQNVQALSALTEANEANRGSTFRLAAAQDDTLAGSLKRTSAAFKDFVLSSKGLAGGVRDMVDGLGDLTRVFAGVDDPLLQANERLNNFASALKVTTVTIGLFFLGIAVGKIFEFVAAVRAATGAMALFNIAAGLNPLLLFGSVLAGVTLAFNLFNPSVKSADEALNELGSTQADEAFGRLAQKLREFNEALKNAEEQGEFQKALELTRSKISLLEAAKVEIGVSLKGEEAAFIKFADFKTILEQSIGDVDLRVSIQEEAARQQIASLAEEAKKRIFEATRIPFPSSLAGFTSGIIKSLEGQFDVPEAAKDKAADALNRAFEDIRVRALTKSGKPILISGADIVNEPEIRDAVSAAVDTVFKTLAAVATPGKIRTEIALGVNQEALNEGLDAAEDQLDKFRVKVSGQKALVRTDEDIQALADLAGAIEKTGKAFEASVQKIRDHNQELQLTAGLDELAAKSVSQGLDARRILNEQIEQKIKLEQEDVTVTKELIEVARTNRAEAIKRGLSITELLAKLEKEKADVAGLSEEYRKQIAVLDEVSEANLKLERSIKAEKDAKELFKDQREALVQLVTQTRDRVSALSQQSRVLIATNTLEGEELATRRAQIELQGVELAFIRQLTDAKKAEGVSIDDLFLALERSLKQEVILSQVKQQQQAIARQTIRDKKQEANAIETLTQNLTAEVAAIGKTNAEKALESRLRRINIGALGAEGEALKQDVALVLKALDQADRAAELGRDVARAFTDPLKDALKSGDFKDLAKKLADNLFDIFFDLQIAKPVEDFFKKKFSTNKAAKGLASPGQTVSSQSEVTAALDRIQAFSTRQLEEANKLAESSANLDIAFSSTESTVNRLREAFEALLEPVKAAARPKAASQDFPEPGFPLPQPRVTVDERAFSPFSPRGVPPSIDRSRGPRGPAVPFKEIPSGVEALGPFQNFSVPAPLPVELIEPDVNAFIRGLRQRTKAALRSEEPLSLELRTVLDQAPKPQPIQLLTGPAAPKPSLLERTRAGALPEGFIGPATLQQSKIASAADLLEKQAVDSFVGSMTAASESAARVMAALDALNASIQESTAKENRSEPGAALGVGPTSNAGEQGEQAANAFTSRFAGAAQQALLSGGDNIGALIVSQIVGLLQDALSASKATPKALGEVFPFQNGNPFSNSVVSKPTTAPLALFGEAGPEAIVPLGLSASGKLAISAFDGSREVDKLPLTRGLGGRLGIDLSGKQRGLRLGATFAGRSGAFQFGEVFRRGGDGPVLLRGGDSRVDNRDESQSQVFNFSPTYNVSGTPTDTFKRSAKQFEDDIRNRTRRSR